MNQSTIDPFLNNSALPRISTSNASTQGGGQNGGRTKSDWYVGKGGPDNKIVARQAEVLDENRIVLYKRGKQLGNGYYIIEISSNNS